MTISVKISVILPYFNGSEFIETTLASVLNQSFSAIEVIIVNDGSRESELLILDQFNDERISVIHQKNAGVSGARNAGIALAEGQWIAFIDQDDRWEPTKLEQQYKHIENNPDCNGIHTAVKSITQDGHVRFFRKKQLMLNDFLLESPNPSYLSSTMIKKDQLLGAGLFNPILRYSQDRECFIRCSRLFPFHYLDEFLTIRLQHDSNLSGNKRGVWSENARINRFYEKEFETREAFRKTLYKNHIAFALLATQDRNWKLFWEIVSEVPRDNISRIGFLYNILLNRLSGNNQ